MKHLPWIIEMTLVATMVWVIYSLGSAWVRKPTNQNTITENKSFGIWESCIQAGGHFSEADAGKLVIASCSYLKLDK